MIHYRPFLLTYCFGTARRSFFRFEPFFGLQVSKKQNVFLRSLAKIQYCGEPLRLRGSVLGLSYHQYSNLESCIWRAVSSHHPQDVFMAQVSLYFHKGGTKLIHSFLHDGLLDDNTGIRKWTMNHIVASCRGLGTMQSMCVYNTITLNNKNTLS